MNQKIFVLLGRAGDILNALPLLKKESDEGHRPALMTQSPFDEILEGVSYCDCILSPAKPGDIPGAIEAARKLSSDVFCLHPQVTAEETRLGKFENIKTDSFAKEAWRLAGRLDLWKENLPLVIDKRDEARENELCPDFLHTKKPTVLVSLGGVSSAFRHKKVLMTALELRFKKKPLWRILDIGKIKAHRLYDLLGIMEKATFLVTSDSAPMHLARAVPTLPVVALMNDRPSLWNGSPWRPEHIWTSRYNDFPRRWPSMMEAMENLYHGAPAFNPCVKLDTTRLIHVFSAYDGISTQAKQSWDIAYQTDDGWLHTPSWFGMFGRDSRFGGVAGEKARFPFVKDVIRCGLMRAKNQSDVIVLTRSDTCFERKFSLREEFERSGLPVFSHRTTVSKIGFPIHHPAVDLFAFTKEWWQKHVSEYPDMVLGQDYFWQRTLRALLLKHGGRELPFLTYQAPKEEK